MSKYEVYRLNNQYLFDPKLRSLQDLSLEGKTTWLGNNEANLLLTFIEHTNKIITKTTLHNEVWIAHGLHVDDSSVIQSISLLRKYLHDSTKKPSYIKTISKKGYLFIAEIEVIRSEQNNKPKVTLSAVKKQKPELLSPAKLIRHKNIRKLPFIILAITLTFIAWHSIYKTETTEIATVDGIKVMALKEIKTSEEEREQIVSCLDVLSSQRMLEGTKRIFVNLDLDRNVTIGAIYDEKYNSHSFSFINEYHTLSQLCLRLKNKGTL